MCWLFVYLISTEAIKVKNVQILLDAIKVIQSPQLCKGLHKHFLVISLYKQSYIIDIYKKKCYPSKQKILHVHSTNV